MINLTLETKHKSKGAVILSAKEYDDIRWELETMKEKLESLVMNLDIYSSYDEIDDSNPFKNYVKNQDMDFMKYQAKTILEHTTKASNILE